MKQIPINRNTLTSSAFNAAVSELLVKQGTAWADSHRYSTYVYDHAGNVLGGVVWRQVQVNRYTHMEEPVGYLHS